MRCFNHSDIEAIGTCKVCQRGLCRNCAVDLGHSLSCKGEHEIVAEAINGLVQRNMNVQKVAGGSKYVAPAFYAFMGAIFLVSGLREPGQIGLPVYMGAGFLVFALVALIINRRAYVVAKRGA